jgi:tRNA A-37 threonylcarbamoyl transferase component Bud32
MLIRIPIGEQNDILTEASHLADLDMFARQNRDLRVSVPEVFYCATSDDPWIIAMQKVPGRSLEDVITENIPVPKDFDFQKFEEDLFEFVRRLNDHGFQHRDLRVGNVMVNLEAKAGEPLAYIIDTGNAKHIYHKTEEEHKFDKSPDPRMLKAAIESLRTYKTRQEQGASK